MDQLLCDETFDASFGNGGGSGGRGLDQLEGLGQAPCWSPSLEFDLDATLESFMRQDELTLPSPEDLLPFREVLPVAPGSPLNAGAPNGSAFVPSGNTYDFQGFNVPTNALNGEWMY